MIYPDLRVFVNEGYLPGREIPSGVYNMSFVYSEEVFQEAFNTEVPIRGVVKVGEEEYDHSFQVQGYLAESKEVLINSPDSDTYYLLKSLVESGDYVLNMTLSWMFNAIKVGKEAHNKEIGYIQELIIEGVILKRK